METVTKTDKTGEVLNILRSPCVDFNRQSEKYWGCLFVPQKNGKFTILAASQYYCFMADNIEADPKGIWFDFYDNCWKNESQYPASCTPEKLIELVMNEANSPLLKTENFGNIIFARDNVINWLSQFEKPVIDRSRLILTHTELGKEEIALKFTQSTDGRKISSLPPVGDFFIDEKSLIPEAFVKPGQSYKCVVTGKNDRIINVSVLEPYGRVNIGIKFSMKAFDPTYMEDWNNLRRLCGEESARAGIYPHNQIICTNAIESPFENWLPIPTHLNTGMILAGCKFMVLSPNKLMSIRVINKPNSNVYMESLDSGPDTPKVRLVHTSLNQSFGMQIR